MRASIPLTKENIKILQNIKSRNPSGIQFRVREAGPNTETIEIEFSKINVSREDYAMSSPGFKRELETSLARSGTPYDIKETNGTYIIEEITEKKILLRLN